MLRWLYTFDYENRFDTGSTTMDFHMDACALAGMYKLRALVEEATVRFSAGLHALPTKKVALLMGKIYYDLTEGYPAELMHAAMTYRDANLRTLLKDASLRPPMRGTPDSCIGIIDKCAPYTRLTVKSWARCTRCEVYRMRPRSAWPRL